MRKCKESGETLVRSIAIVYMAGPPGFDGGGVSAECSRNHDQMFCQAHDALMQKVPERMRLCDFERAHTHAEVLALVDRAIEELEGREKV